MYAVGLTIKWKKSKRVRWHVIKFLESLQDLYCTADRLLEIVFFNKMHHDGLEKNLDG